jgi:hypothetical protein
VLAGFGEFPFFGQRAARTGEQAHRTNNSN